MKRYKTKIVISISIAVIITFAIWLFLHAMRNAHEYQWNATNTKLILQEYVRANKGKFPSSENDLIKQGFLRRTKMNDEYTYELRYDRSSSEYWNECARFNMFDISYGIDISEIMIKDNELFRKEDRNLFYLIKGPPAWPMKHEYMNISVLLAKEMQDHKNKGD